MMMEREDILKKISEASMRASEHARDVRVDARLGTAEEVRADMEALLNEVEFLQTQVDLLAPAGDAPSTEPVI